MWGLLYVALAALFLQGSAAGVARLVCYVDSPAQGLTECTHVVYTGDVRGDKLEAVLKEIRKGSSRAKIVVRVGGDDKDYRTLLKSKYIQGLEIHDAHRTLNRTKVTEAAEAARLAINSAGGGPLLLALPAHPELLAKYYDLRALVKKADLMMVQTHALGKVKKMTYHPSRLSGLWDMMNTDSVVDLVVGLGVPASKIVISLPASAQQFTLQNETLSTPGSPTTEDEPKEIGQAELCRLLQKGRWTLERDQDLSAPYAFQDKTWIAFEDSSSVDVKGKYARVRGLGGLALHHVDRDEDTPCGATLRTALTKVLNQQSRAPRAVILRSLEQEILSAPGHGRALDALQVSPYRITQIVDSDGVIHSVREDTRTEFSCSRQGYFVHPRSCARFYRCVKFDQLSPEFTVFEFDCPSGLAFDARYEVCVWPGSLPDTHACPGSSEIAPVPRTRFICPEHEGYFADPENCRWFFACLDHGKAPLTAYEFRCPFGLGFDAERLKCDWPWKVPGCGNIARYEAEVHGYSGALLTGAAGFQGQTADSINIEGHQSLVSGASIDNLVGIQGGFLTKADALDSNFIGSQEYAAGSNLDHNGGLVAGVQNIGLVQPTTYVKEPKYTSGSLILDDYRLPTKKTNGNAQIIGAAQNNAQYGYSNAYSTADLGQAGVNTYSTANVAQGQGIHTYSTSNLGQADGYSTASFNKQSNAYQGSNFDAENSGAYVHDPTGDYAEPYRHVDAAAEPYLHQGSGYKHSSDYYDYGRYKGSAEAGFSSPYAEDNSGQYVHDYSGDYKGTSNGYKTGYSGSYTADYSGAYTHDNSGQYVAGVYRSDGHIGNGERTGSVNSQSYSQANAGNYIQDSKAYTGASHTLTAGAVNVGLVGKTTLVDADYVNQFNYQRAQGLAHQTLHPGHVTLVSQPAVSISHVGTDENNLDGYGYITTPTSSGIPTTATPFAVTTALPAVTYKTTFVPEPPKSTVKQIFGYSQPQITTVRPALVAVKQEYFTPEFNVGSKFNQGLNYQFESKDYSAAKSQSQSTIVKESGGYDYSKPSIKFEDGVSYTTAAPAVVSSYKPAGFSHSQQTHHVDSVGYQYSTPVPITEEPLKKLVAYTTGTPVTFAQPTAAYYPQAYSHQTIHKTEVNNIQIPLVSHEVRYEQPQIVQYTTAQPALAVQPIVSTYQPQIVSQQTLHKVDANRVNTYSQESSSGYKYEKPAVKFEEGMKTVQYVTPAAPTVSTYKPQAYSHQVLHKFESQPQVIVSTPAPVQYELKPTPVTIYQNPILKYIEPKVTPVTYVKPAYNPQAYSHQTIHKFDTYTPSVETGYDYSKPKVSYEQPKVIHYTTSQPALAVQPIVPTYQPQVVSHQTYHKVDAGQVKTYSEAESGYQYSKPSVKFEYEAPRPYKAPEYIPPKTGYEQSYSVVSTPAPAVLQTVHTYSTPSPVVSTYKPQTYSHQTLHKVESQQFVPVSSTTPKIDYTYQTADVSGSGYQYSAPSVKFVNVPQTVQTYSTPAPVVVSTYKPQIYSHQTLHKVEEQAFDAGVSTYENPILTYTKKITPVTYVKSTPAAFTKTYQPIIQQHEVRHEQANYYEGADQSYEQEVQLNQGYTYSRPEIQTNSEVSGQTYSDASVVSHQTFNLDTNSGSGKKVVFVSTTPATLAYEDHYAEYEAPKKIETYKAPEYIPPKTEYQQQSYSVSTAAPTVQQTLVSHDQYDVRPLEYSQQYDTVQNTAQQVSFSTSHATLPRIESVHRSTFPGVKVTTKYKPTTYDNPEIQVEYKAEEYLPPVVSTVVPAVTTTYRPVVTTTYQPRTYSTTSKQYLPPTTTREYLPPIKPREYLPPVVTNSYLPPSTTARPVFKSTTFKPSEYLPPISEQKPNVVNFESFGYNFGSTPEPQLGYNPYQEEVSVKPILRKPNIVVETAKNLLGFGTVGPDAGLVSPVTYTTSAPVISSTTYRPVVKSTTPTYKYVESTTAYKAPEYLPPSEETKLDVGEYGFRSTEKGNNRYNSYRQNVVVSTSAPVQRKQNIVVQTAKANLLGFGTVGPDAGLVSPVTYSSSTPVVFSSTESYTAAPQIVTSTYAPVEQGHYEVTSRRRTKPKVAVVTKINDFNPLLVRKLGAVCSCQSQSPVLVLKGTKSNNTPKPKNFDDYGNDYSESGRGDISDYEWAQKSSKLSSAQVVTSTPNPIIVPEDSYYQDYYDQGYDVAVTPKQEVYVSSTTPVVTSTEKLLRLRPRVKTVTVAPTYRTVLLKQEVAPTPLIGEAEASAVDSQTFDRYGPGGWRSRDETLQGSVDCKRAGLFRHPKQCNKFYACRWDCTKQRFTLHVFNCPVQLSFDPSLGACNWPSQGPACQGDTLLTNTL